jgi:hypothetical protein
VDSPSVYELRVSNQGWPAAPLGDASGVVAELALPASTVVTSLPAGCSNSGATVTCLIGSLSAGTFATRSIGTTQTAAGILCENSTVTENETEINSSDNARPGCHVFNLAQGADLIVWGFDLRLDCKKKGKKCSVVGKVDILNVGTVDSPNSRLRLVLSGNNVLDPADPLLKEWKVPAMPYLQVPPPIYESVRTIHVKAKLPPGPNGLLAIVADSGNLVPEQDEANNVVFYGPFP